MHGHSRLPISGIGIGAPSRDVNLFCSEIHVLLTNRDGAVG